MVSTLTNKIVFEQFSAITYKIIQKIVLHHHTYIKHSICDNSDFVDKYLFTTILTIRSVWSVSHCYQSIHPQ